MRDVFEGLPEEKKQRIINVCVEEFALKGYEISSTNSMVKKAGISKGALFSYFGNKKSLFLYLFDFSLERLMNSFDEAKDEAPSDLFERCVWYSLLKMKIYLKEPLLSRLVVSSVTNMPRELEKELQEKIERVQGKYIPQLFDGLNTSNFKEGVDPQKVLELITIFLDGLFDKYLKTYKHRPVEEIFNNMEEVMKEYNEYIEMLKNGVYKS